MQGCQALQERENIPVFRLICLIMYDYKTSYLDSVHQRICSNDVESAEPQDTGKTLGE
jgi:hypothetical protein